MKRVNPEQQVRQRDMIIVKYVYNRGGPDIYSVYIVVETRLNYMIAISIPDMEAVKRKASRAWLADMEEEYYIDIGSLFPSDMFHIVAGYNAEFYMPEDYIEYLDIINNVFQNSGFKLPIKSIYRT